MGMGFAYLEYLSERGHLSKEKPKILDIGSQNLYHATVARIRAFVDRHGGVKDEAAFAAAAARISRFSTPRPGERTSYVSELFDLTDIFYTSYDVCPAVKTEIFDLNREALPEPYRGFFDVVLNFGTTEHVFNQLNSYAVMHDALAVGGVMFHQLPSVGWVNHGYFNYHKQFFSDLAEANGFETVDAWYTLEGRSRLLPREVDVRDQTKPLEPHSRDVPERFQTVANYNLNIVLRKTCAEPFAVGLELATSHAALSDSVRDVYGPHGKLVPAEAGRPLGLAREDALEALRRGTEAAGRDIEAVRRETEAARRDIDGVRCETEAARRDIEAVRCENEAARRDIGEVRRRVEAVQSDVKETIPFLIEKAVQDVASEMLPPLVRDAVRRTVESDLQAAVSRAVRSAIDEAVARRMLQLNTGAVRDTPTRELVREVGRRFKRR